MTDPVPDRPPQEPRPEAAVERKREDRQYGEGCFGVLLILMGIPLVLLGSFLGLCAIKAASPLVLLIGIVPLGLGIWFLTQAGKVRR